MKKFHFFFSLVLLPWLFYLVRRDVAFRAVIRYRNHTEVFNYLSNVTKFRLLNPTIIRIDRWERTDEANFHVEYTECLSQAPAIWNYAHASYNVRHDADGSHELLSQHFTCFFNRFMCLSTNSSLRIGKLSESEAGYQEKISYSCPWLLTKFCFQEVAFQRRLITTKLNEIFSNTGKPPNNHQHIKKIIQTF